MKLFLRLNVNEGSRAISEIDFPRFSPGSRVQCLRELLNNHQQSQRLAQISKDHHLPPLHYALDLALMSPIAWRHSKPNVLGTPSRRSRTNELRLSTPALLQFAILNLTSHLIHQARTSTFATHRWVTAAGHSRTTTSKVWAALSVPRRRSPTQRPRSRHG